MIDLNQVNHAITTLQSIVASPCQQKIATGQHQVTLHEKKAAAKDRLDEVHIDNIKDPLGLFFPDKAKPVLCGFLAVGNTQKACDAILATSYKGIGYLIVCEMKSGSTKGVSSQLKNTDCFVDLLIRAAWHHHGVDLAAWERRYVILCTGPLKKSKTRIGQPTSGFCPSRPKEIQVRNRQKLPIGALCLPRVTKTTAP